MNRLLKYLSICLFLVLACNICFGQFTEVNPREGRLKGKVDSVLFMNFNAKQTDAGEVKEFNDKCTYVYNAKGLLIEERMSDEEGDEPGQFKTIYNYDAKGNRIQLLDFKRKGVLKAKSTYTFNAAKRLVEVRNTRTVTSKMLLDKQGNILEETVYDKYPMPFTTFRYKYNGKGVCIERYQTWAKSTDAQKIEYAYDANGNLVKETTINNLTPLATYTYSYDKFDKMHNWLTQRIYRNRKLYGITERTITYK